MGNELERRVNSDVVDMRDAATDSWTSVLQDVVALSENISGTDFVPKELRSTTKTAAAILTGRELGLPPMTALASIHVINGKPGISAEMMRALIQRDGHELDIRESSEVKCVIRGRRRGEEDWTQVTYTMAEAQRAGDAKKNPNYQTRPAEMLLARATTRIARMKFSDTVHGLSSIEELQSLVEDDQAAAAPAHIPAPKTTQAVGRVRSRARKAPAPEIEAAAPAAPAEPVENPEPQETAVLVDAEPVEIDAETGEVRENIASAEATEDPAAAVLLGGGQKVQIVQHWKRLGVTECDERIHWTSVLAGRDIKSTSDLTRLEARRLIEILGKLRDREALEARLGIEDEGGDE